MRSPPKIHIQVCIVARDIDDIDDIDDMGTLKCCNIR